MRVRNVLRKGVDGGAFVSRSGNWRTTERRGPLMKTLWSQSNGYNNFVTTYCSGTRAPVGCVATAVGQIMTFHQSPNIFKGRWMNWDKMVNVKPGKMFSNYESVPEANRDARDDISHLLFRLGDDDLLNMNYGCASGAFTDDALKTLKKLGYNSAYKTGYNNSKVISEIRNNRPVYIEGCGIRRRRERCFLWWCSTSSSYSSCHAWVLDGYVRRSQIVTVTRESKNCNSKSYSYIRTLELIHNNFGWGQNSDEELDGGASNSGWYHKGLFDSNNGPEEKSNTFRSDNPYNFKYSNNILVHIQ